MYSKYHDVIMSSENPDVFTFQNNLILDHAVSLQQFEQFTVGEDNPMDRPSCQQALPAV